MSTEEPLLDGRARLGDRAKDLVTGFEGIITHWTEWMTGCDRIYLEPEKLDANGKVQGGESFDETRVVVTARGVVAPRTLASQQQLKLGSKARDTVSGFTGTLSGKATFLSGLVRYGIEANTLDDKGAAHPVHWVDAARVALIESRPVPVSPNAPLGLSGGPQRGEETLRA